MALKTSTCPLTAPCLNLSLAQTLVRSLPACTAGILN